MPVQRTKINHAREVTEPCRCGHHAMAWPIDAGKQWAIACFSDDCEQEVTAATLADALIDWHELNGKAA